MADQDENIEQEDINQNGSDNGELGNVINVSGLYEEWFLDYASYVILERAVPHLNDGLKPVQRRLLHSLKEMDDGRYHKVANVIGNTMKYHPHGDASIGDALVQLGQKDILIDTQGNWGNIFTGDRAAASRYIEARLTKFALDVVFNPKTTEWQASYDSRGKEPVTLPVKFPLLLAQGAEGIAVGLACKMLPHNFNELIDASIKVLKGKKPKILPDFPTAGMADFSNYDDGLRGGRIKIRARIKQEDKKTLIITEIPFGTTTSSLIDSVIKANDKGKIKIKKIEDNTAEFVEIMIHLPPNTSPDKTIDALYAFTDCEVSISPNACVIENDKPRFVGVSEMLQISTAQTLELLKRELEIRKAELEEQWHFASLEKIFIENRIYRDIEECETWEAVIEAIDKGIHKYISTPSKPNKSKGAFKLIRDITEDDIVRLTEIKIKRISKYDSFKADENLKKLEEEIAKVQHHLENLIDYAIDYFSKLKEKYGKGRERKTEIKSFETIDVTKVVVANARLYVNREEGFVGTGLRKDEFVEECSDIDDIIIFREDGKFMVTKVDDKTFVGKGIIHVAVWQKGDDRMVYNMIYRDGASKKSFVKRFSVTGVTRDKEYDLTKGSAGTKVHYFTANPNAESEIVTVFLTGGCKAKKKVFDFDFAELDIKGRGSKGNTLTKWPIKRIEQKTEGHSTLGGIDIWFDETVGRLNTDERGQYLGNFMGDDTILVIYKDGEFELTSFELTNRYEWSDIEALEKFDPEKPLSVVYYDGDKKNYFVKRFLVETKSIGQRFNFIGDAKNSRMEILSLSKNPVVEVKVKKGKKGIPEEETVNIEEFIDIKGWKSLGNRLSLNKVTSLKLISEDPYETSNDDNAGNDDESEKPELQDEKKQDEKPQLSETKVSEPKKDSKPPQKGKSSAPAKEKKSSSEEDEIEVGSGIEWDVESGSESKVSKEENQGSLF